MADGLTCRARCQHGKWLRCQKFVGWKFVAAFLWVYEFVCVCVRFMCRLFMLFFSHCCSSAHSCRNFKLQLLLLLLPLLECSRRAKVLRSIFATACWNTLQSCKDVTTACLNNGKQVGEHTWQREKERGVLWENYYITRIIQRAGGVRRARPSLSPATQKCIKSAFYYFTRKLFTTPAFSTAFFFRILSISFYIYYIWRRFYAAPPPLYHSLYCNMFLTLFLL